MSKSIKITEFTKLLNEREIYDLRSGLVDSSTWEPGWRMRNEAVVRHFLKNDICDDGENITLKEFNLYCKPFIKNEATLAKIMKAFGEEPEPTPVYPVQYIDEISASPFQSKINNIRATIEKQLRKLQDTLDQEKEWMKSQEIQSKLQSDYDNAYTEFYSKPTDANGQAPLPEKRMAEALKHPLGTAIMLHNLSFEDREKMGALLKEFYENNIKTLSLNTKILVHYYVNGAWIIKPLDNANVRTSLEKMLAGDYNFTCDELETIGSDVDAKFSLSFIDGIKFTVLEKKEKKNPKERSNHASAFFPYRLTQEFKPFKQFTRRLAIGCKIYSYKHKCPKTE